jgi:hypothetical protein
VCAAARLLFALGRAGLAPRLGRVDASLGAPGAAIVLAGGLCLLGILVCAPFAGRARLSTRPNSTGSVSDEETKRPRRSERRRSRAYHTRSDPALIEIPHKPAWGRRGSANHQWVVFHDRRTADIGVGCLNTSGSAGRWVRRCAPYREARRDSSARAVRSARSCRRGQRVVRSWAHLLRPVA